MNFWQCTSVSWVAPSWFSFCFNFFPFHISVEHDHEESTAALEKLENIDSETDNLDITFVKMADSRYARKWGVTKLPALVYFRKRFPSIYRGDFKNSIACNELIVKISNLSSQVTFCRKRKFWTGCGRIALDNQSWISSCMRWFR